MSFDPVDGRVAVEVELGELAELLEPPVAGDRSNRIKYRCPSCSVQVWGKPGLRLLCGGDRCDSACFDAL